MRPTKYGSKRGEPDTTSGGLDWPATTAAAFARRELRKDFDALPAHKQAEKLADVRHLLAREHARRQRSHSALWQLAPDVYGINPEECR